MNRQIDAQAIPAEKCKHARRISYARRSAQPTVPNPTNLLGIHMSDMTELIRFNCC